MKTIASCRNRWIIFLSFITVVLITSACNKRPNQIGADILPNQGLISLVYTDSVDIVAYSLADDSVRTDHTEANLAGSMKDPVFGTTIAGFYTQLRLSTSTHNFGENPLLDSLVLQLVYSGYYGDTLAPQTFKVHELLDSLDTKATYYSNQLKTVSTTDFANFTFSPKPTAPFVSNNDTLPAMLRIRLSDVSPELGNKILAATSDNLSSNKDFQNYFMGLYVTAEAVNQGGAILSFNLPVTNTKMTIYYKNNTADSLHYDFFITSNEAAYNTYTHLDYAGAATDLQSQIHQADSLAGRNRIYLQAMGGLKAKLRFPGLARIKQQTQGKIVVNEAKLILTPTVVDTSTYLLPSQLALVRNNNDGTYKVLEDQVFPNFDFGGSYQKGSNNYRFRINQYVQELLMSDSLEYDPGLFLFIQGGSAKANRLIINGNLPQTDTLTRLQLQINYSVVSGQ